VAKISLRDYLSGIAELIDDERTEEALAHCHHILALFPKNIATYQMMGKTYLEAHRHSDARDIFQRVLSSSPDDFISHIGMSIIHEEAGDLDGSIWNMERAFEAQPSNRAVQDELRRLYGKREGYAPPKVRLTRGALARMYAHGDLYNQAIGELRAALAEDQQRPDLQILLAEMYYKTKRETEAIEVCSLLLEKLPYCLYANRLMVNILRGSHREAEAQPYIARVEEMDPYAALVDTQTPVDSAPAESVMLEQLVYEAPVEMEQVTPKAWTTPLEMESSFEKEDLPEWLSVDSVGEPEQKNPEETSKQPSATMDSLENLEPIHTSELGTPNVETPNAALTDDQVPDWLRELRPSTTSFAAGEENSESQSEAEKPIEEEKPKEHPSAFFTEELRLEELTENPPVSEPLPEEDESLGWLEKLAAQQGAPEEELLTTPEARESAKPDWLPEEKPEDKRDVLAWLDEMASEDQSVPTQATVAEAPTTEPVDEISQFAEEDKGEAQGTTPSWLKELSAEIEESTPTSEIEANEVTPRPLEEAPDWLSELRPSQDEINKTQKALEEPIVSEAEESGMEGDSPYWLSELRPSTDEISKAQKAREEPVASEVEETEMSENFGKLDWLEEMGPPKVPPAEPVKGEWLPEMKPAIETEKGQPAPVSVPVVSPRRTAALLAEQEAPGRLEQARQALNYGKLNEAADHYGYLLHRRLLIKDVIADLDAAVHRHPGDATLWQTLGDAYMRNNQLREALDCYTRAEDLL